jgi:hypothetical protein
MKSGAGRSIAYRNKNGNGYLIGLKINLSRLPSISSVTIINGFKQAPINNKTYQGKRISKALSTLGALIVLREINSSKIFVFRTVGFRLP